MSPHFMLRTEVVPSVLRLEIVESRVLSVIALDFWVASILLETSN